MESKPPSFPDLNWAKPWSATVSIACMTARKCSFPRSVRPMRVRKGRIDFWEGRTDRLESIITAGTEMSNEGIRRTRLDMPQVHPLTSRKFAPATR
jgi:hypothetical protein